MERQATIVDHVDAASDNVVGRIYQRMPGTVVAFYPGTAATPPMVDVQPMVNDVRLDVQTGGKVSEPWPVLQKVPVAWPNFGGFVLSGPLAPMDQVMLEAWDRDPSAYQAQGRSQLPVDPPDVRKLGGNYWVARPLDIITPLKSFAAAAAGAVIGYDGGPGIISFSSSGLKLGGPTAADFVALASKVDACMAAIKTHTHPVPAAGLVSAAPGNPVTGAAVASASASLSSLPATGSAVIGAT